jgi:stage V sporulation protein T
MIATGIVRRIDDLGRVVIPKEIRRNLRIKEGDALELFTTKDGEVVFKKYSFANEQDWAKAKDLVNAMYPELKFALYNDLGEKQAITYLNAPKTFEIKENAIYNNARDLIGYIYYGSDISIANAEKIEKMLGQFFSTNY